MMHNTQALYGALNDQLHDLNAQIEVVKSQAEAQIAESPWAAGVTALHIKDTTGKNVLTDLLVAKANVLSGMAALKAADLSSKAPVARERRR